MEIKDKSIEIIKPRRPWLRWLKRLGWGLLLLLILAICVLVWWHHTLQKRLDEALAELSRTDPGWRLEDIEAARATIPDEDNSARIIATAGALLPKEWEPNEIAKVCNKLLPQEQLAPDALNRLNQELDSVRPALAEARKLAGLMRGRHRIEYARNIIGTLLIDQSKILPLTRLLLGDAVRHEQAPKIREAIHSCQAALNAGRSIGDEPMAVSQLIRTASVVWSCRGIERALAQGEPSTDDLIALQKLIADEDDFPDLFVNMRGERAATHAMFDGFESGEVPLGDARGAEAFLSGFLFHDLVRAEHPHMLSLMSRWLATIQLSATGQAAAEEGLELEASVMPKAARLTRLMTPAFTKIGKRSRLKHALLRCTLAALATERYRQTHKG